MVSDSEEDKSRTSAVEPSDEKNTPNLPPEYFLELIGAPTCRTKGYCDNCGKCEY